MQVNPTELIILTNQKSQFKIFFSPEMEFSCHKGTIRFGKTLHYGELVFTNKDEYFLVIHPNSSDKMFKAIRSTTIVYPKDFGKIILELGIISGSRVAEIGTGTGVSTFTLANIVGKEGKIDTIDISSEKQTKGKKNFARHSKF